MRKIWLPWAVLAVAVFAGAQVVGRPRGEYAPDSVRWRAEPVQTETDRAPFTRRAGRRELTLRPRAAMEVAAVVAGTERYRFDDLAPLAPVDAILTWGDLPDPTYADRISYDQMARFYLWSTRARDLDLEYVETHSANFHLMPATPNLRRALLRLGRGDEARLRGLLVDVRDDAGGSWKTSLSRNDTGAGACEILWVEELQVGDRVFR